MPTKLNKGGEEQEYIPAGNGDKSGEYADGSGSNKHFTNFKQPKADDSKKTSAEQKTYSGDSKGMKEKLKDNGIDTKGIRIKKDNGGYSRAYHVTITDPTIDKDKVEKLLSSYESYERDVATGEILEGGNTFVFVNYDYDVFNEPAKKYMNEAEDLITKAKNNNGNGVDLGENYYMFYDKDTQRPFVHKNGVGSRDIYEAEDLATYMYQIKQFGRIVGKR